MYIEWNKTRSKHTRKREEREKKIWWKSK